MTGARPGHRSGRSGGGAGHARPLHLTFDDGPDPSWTPRVLDLLTEHDATATFFVLGAAVRQHPELARGIAERGHALELHGEAHLPHDRSTHSALAADTERAIDALRGIEVTPSLWRLPWGRPGQASADIAERHDLSIVSWDHDTHDWRGDGWGAQPDAVKRAGEHGGIVLLHDGFGPGQPRTDAHNTLEIAAALLARARAAGVPARALPTGDDR